MQIKSTKFKENVILSTNQHAPVVWHHLSMYYSHFQHIRTHVVQQGLTVLWTSNNRHRGQREDNSSKSSVTTKHFHF